MREFSDCVSVVSLTFCFPKRLSKHRKWTRSFIVMVTKTMRKQLSIIIIKHVRLRKGQSGIKLQRWLEPSPHEEMVLVWILFVRVWAFFGLFPKVMFHKLIVGSAINLSGCAPPSQLGWVTVTPMTILRTNRKIIAKKKNPKRWKAFIFVVCLCPQINNS